MNVSPPQTVNHHADHPGFGGVTGLLCSALFLALGRAKARLALDIASVSATDRVVDIGCGPGVAVRAAARRGAHAIGVDPAPVMLQVARAVTRGRSNVEWAEGTAENLPVPTGSATVVWSLATVHHWKDVTAGLSEAHRVLAPGGRVLAIERQSPPDATGLASHGWTEHQAESFAAQCRTAGFDDVRVEGRGSGRRAVWAVHGVKP
jgi:ubiquinone/menaquinone biosynthesis C-methylase UbiE